MEWNHRFCLSVCLSVCLNSIICSTWYHCLHHSVVLLLSCLPFWSDWILSISPIYWKTTSPNEIHKYISIFHLCSLPRSFLWAESHEQTAHQCDNRVINEIWLNCNLNISTFTIISSLLYSLTVIHTFNSRCCIYSLCSSSCLLQECHWWSLAWDYAVLSEWAHLWLKIRHSWKGVREWLCLLLLRLLHFPLFFLG